MTNVACEVSWNVGLWRGENGYRLDVPLSLDIDLDSYTAGYNYGLSLRPVQLRRAA